ncbi:MAG: hypothetical protein M3P33_04445 [bacterium]|nr:hypothetical protein [bacterium]
MAHREHASRFREHLEKLIPGALASEHEAPEDAIFERQKNMAKRVIHCIENGHNKAARIIAQEILGMDIHKDQL